MKSAEKKNIVFARFLPGEDANKKLIELCKKHDINSGVILSGIGQFEKVELGYFKCKGDYSHEIFEKPLEVLSLTGNICKNGDEHILHIHAVLSDDKKNVFGGHFINAIVSITCEIVIQKTNIIFKRELDEKTGLKNIIFK
jgi:predicted DNA-binding protein with PD1-like motif